MRVVVHCMVVPEEEPEVVLPQLQMLILPREVLVEHTQVEQVVLREQLVIRQQVEVQEVQEQYFYVVLVEEEVGVRHLM
jgi:hypothetical protein